MSPDAVPSGAEDIPDDALAALADTLFAALDIEEERSVGSN